MIPIASFLTQRRNTVSAVKPIRKSKWLFYFQNKKYRTQTSLDVTKGARQERDKQQPAE